MLVIVVTVVAGGQLSSGEALSRSLGWALLTIYGLPYRSMAVPALLLAALNRYLPIALVLSLLVIPAVWLFVRYAWRVGSIQIAIFDTVTFVFSMKSPH